MKNLNQEEQEPNPHDLVVIPEGAELKGFIPCNIYKMKFLSSPSVIKSRGNIMFQPSGLKNIVNWVKNRLQEKSEDISITSRSDLQEECNQEQILRFYRHIRVWSPGYSRYESWTIDAKGGLTFGIDFTPGSKKFYFSYAICRKDELFNKKAAKSVCKSRLESMDTYIVHNYNPVYSLVENIHAAIRSYLTTGFNSSNMEGIRLEPSSRYSSSKSVLRTVLKEIEKLIERNYCLTYTYDDEAGINGAEWVEGWEGWAGKRDKYTGRIGSTFSDLVIGEEGTPPPPTARVPDLTEEDIKTLHRTDSSSSCSSCSSPNETRC
jgi:hypothetical protein